MHTHPPHVCRGYFVTKKPVSRPSGHSKKAAELSANASFQPVGLATTQLRAASVTKKNPKSRFYAQSNTGGGLGVCA
ncbi:hypothetical protein GGTG_01992 [Gaeumannomyces tritici R3-111a-1]|uniref:Uncharacterized protein n=1 Tax=Gaeumannomyces tritici (strain R3-111a-1) TaxID=644352 RepID=J3NL51_GAET3|nr:hypothetical protein GGTG_01992 [Gaeumannomyces tritici R3-111a-1]EJT82018.1 hypothetical protein GGTG_01992 [Gaeumannomyces tritici R3-111a-1]